MLENNYVLIEIISEKTHENAERDSNTETFECRPRGLLTQPLNLTLDLYLTYNYYDIYMYYRGVTAIPFLFFGIRDTNRAGIYCNIVTNAATFAMYSLRGIPLSWRDFVRWAFLPATDTDLQRF